jgi:uncharacterized membrane protein YkoI
MVRFRWSLGLGLVCATLALAGVAVSEEAKPKWTGSIRVEGKHTEAELKQMAKITAAEAARAALAAVAGKAADKKAVETELEVEHGFLVYEVEVRVNGQGGEHEVIVDAGNGKVLAQEVEDDDDDD